MRCLISIANTIQFKWRRKIGFSFCSAWKMCLSRGKITDNYFNLNANGSVVDSISTTSPVCFSIADIFHKFDVRKSHTLPQFKAYILWIRVGKTTTLFTDSDERVLEMPLNSRQCHFFYCVLTIDMDSVLSKYRQVLTSRSD